MTAVWAVSGPPASGKTTALLALCASHASIQRFGVRDYILDLARSGHPLGIRLREPLMRCEVLTDADVRAAFTLFLERLPPDTRTLIVEGYPRNARQMADLAAVAEDWGLRLNGLLLLEAPDDVLIARARRRRVCSICNRPADGAFCACSSAAVARPDDEITRLSGRLDDHRKVARILRDTAESPTIIDAARSHTEIRRNLEAIMGPWSLGPAKSD
jgi:adenylate kinase family enzyme